jgi:hypothetical protein
MCLRISAIFVKKTGSEGQRVTQNSVGEGEVLVTSMPAKKKMFRKRRSGLRPSEKELLELRSSTFRHKNTPAQNNQTENCGSQRT